MIAWSIPGSVLMAMAALARLSRHQRRHRARLALQQAMQPIRRQQRADITADLAEMTDTDITWELIGICQASAAAEHTHNPATGK